MGGAGAAGGDPFGRLAVLGAVLGAVGWAFCGHGVYRAHERRAPLARLVFAGTFALSLTPVALALVEAARGCPPGSSSAWRLLLALLVADLGGVVPFSAGYVALRDRDILRAPAACAGALCAGALSFTLWRVGGAMLHSAPPSPSSPGAVIDEVWDTSLGAVLAEAFGRFSCLGVIAGGVLSGFGAARLAFQALDVRPAAWGGPCPKEGVRRAARLREQLAQALEQASAARAREAEDAEAAGGGLRRRGPRGGGGEGPGGVGVLQALLGTGDLGAGGLGGASGPASAAALEALGSQLFLEATEAEEAAERARGAGTRRGAVWAALVSAGAALCALQVVAGLGRIALRTSGLGDPTGLAVGWALWLFSRSPGRGAPPPPPSEAEEARAALAQVVALGFVAVVAANSLRAFMGHVAKLAFRVNSGCATSRAAVILLAELTGLYFCGALVMLRQKLPQAGRVGLEGALAGRVEFAHFHAWFDVFFVVSAAVSALTFAARRGIARSEAAEDALDKWS